MDAHGMKSREQHLQSNLSLAKNKWGKLPKSIMSSLEEILLRYGLSVGLGDLLYLDGRWYVTHAGLLRLARRNQCRGIRIQPVREFCDPGAARYAFRAIVYRSSKCRGLVGYGDADPSNVSPIVRGAEMRVAETRAVNRALRKAYGIGICSVEEIGSEARSAELAESPKKLPSQSVHGNGWKAEP